MLSFKQTFEWTITTRFHVVHRVTLHEPTNMSESLYASFAQVLTLSQGIKDDLSALLDPVSGFAPRLRQLCRNQ